MNDLTTVTQEPIDAMLATALKLGEAFAASGMFGCTKKEQGTVLAMHCIMERKSPLTILSENHIIDGKLSMRADAMLAKLSQAGGNFQWKADGSDGKTATLAVTFKGREGEATYSMQDAVRACLCRKGSAWEKNPDAMLRARCISKTMRMYAPELVAGYYTPEEVADFEPRHEPETKLAKLAPGPCLSVKTWIDGQKTKCEPATEVPVSTTANTTANNELIAEFCSTIIGYESLAHQWFVDHGWLAKNQNISDLPEDKMQKVIDRKAEFISQLVEKVAQ